MDIKRQWCHTGRFISCSLLRMWTIQKPLNNSIFLQGRGTSQKQIFFVCAGDGLKKKSFFKKATRVCVICNMVFKDWVFKREKWISELPSGRFPVEVTPESCVFVTLRHSASGVPSSGPCHWTWTQRYGAGLPEPWGVYLSVSGTMSPNHQLPASFSPAPLPPLPQAQRTLIPFVVLSLCSATCCPRQGLCATPSWTSRAAGTPTALRSLLFWRHIPQPCLQGRQWKKRWSLVNIYWNWWIYCMACAKLSFKPGGIWTETRQALYKRLRDLVYGAALSS